MEGVRDIEEGIERSRESEKEKISICSQQNRCTSSWLQERSEKNRSSKKAAFVLVFCVLFLNRF